MYLLTNKVALAFENINSDWSTDNHMIDPLTNQDLVTLRRVFAAGWTKMVRMILIGQEQTARPQVQLQDPLLITQQELLQVRERDIRA